MQEGGELQGFIPARAHVSLQEVYGEFPHHNDGTHLAGGFMDDAVWKNHWRWITAQSASWYSTSSRKVGCQFTEGLALEWPGVIDWK